MSRLIKNPKEEGKYLAHGDDGKTYEATKVNKYMPGRVMFFCVPAHVKIVGYSRPTTKNNHKTVKSRLDMIEKQRNKQIKKPTTKTKSITSRGNDTKKTAKAKKRVSKK